MVPELYSERNNSTAVRPSTDKPNFLARLITLTEGIDFLLTHPAIKSPEFILGVFMLRHTILFGKFRDQMTHKQQTQGIGRLNRGTHISRRRVSTACKTLTEIGFMEVIPHTGDWRGNEYAINVQLIRDYIHSVRAEGKV